jgi:hypothetical protein
LHVSAKGLSQEEKVTLTLKNASIPQLFKSIEKVTEYRFAYSNDILPREFLVTISVKETPVSSVLKTALSETGLKFSLIDNEVIVISKDISGMASITLSGTVTSEAGSPLPGVSVYVKGTASLGTITNEKGFYRLEVPQEATALIFSSIDMQTTEVAIAGKTEINVILKRNITEQEEVVIIGYGTQKKKDLTGSISTIDPKMLNKIATNDVLKAMQGQVAGVSVTSGGQPGAAPAGVLEQLNKASSAEDFFALLGVDYDPQHVNVVRLHILRRMGQYLVSENFTGQPDAYGIKGIADPANTPGSRSAFCHWKDSIGNFWFFGGLNQYTSPSSNYNDVWMYDPVNNNWQAKTSLPDDGRGRPDRALYDAPDDLRLLRRKARRQFAPARVHGLFQALDIVERQGYHIVGYLARDTGAHGRAVRAAPRAKLALLG